MNPLAPTFSRRRFAAGAALALAGLATRAGAQSPGPRPWLADMHSHYGQWLPRLFGHDLPRHLREQRIMLLAWAIVDDLPWISSPRRGVRQTGVPAPGELWRYFQGRVAECDERLRAWGVSQALTPDDIDAALAGQPRLLLAAESANFLEGQPERVAQAHALGVRHLQLVHYIQSPLGDHQTAEPVHGGLTPLGARVVAECRRLGLLVDLAHGTAALVDGALDATDQPMVWSHSWISPAGGAYNGRGYLARSLALPMARKLAVRGGVVGLWSLRLRGEYDYPVTSTEAYADEIVRMCELIGPQHVAFGTDMEGVGANALMGGYDGLQEVAGRLVQRGLDESLLQGVFLGNYARVVRQAMAGPTA